MGTSKTQRVRVTRQFYQKGKGLGVGSVLDLPVATAFEMKTANKVEFVQADTKVKAVGLAGAKGGDSK